MIEKFKKKLRQERQNPSWFYRRFRVKSHAGLTFSQFWGQLNGDAPVSGKSKKLILEYLGEK
jgi:hypothetical protein